MCHFVSASWRSIAAKRVTHTSDPTTNQLLAALPGEELTRWRPHLEPVEMNLGQVLYEPPGCPSYSWFPCTAVVALLYVTESGKSVEIALVGNEGVVGISSFMGGEPTPSRAVVQCSGLGYRMNAQAVMDEFNRSAPVMHLLLRYTQALITQMAQSAVCNRHHSICQQVSRWLLMTLDRHESNELDATQELIADLLGVRRVGVTQASHELQRAGLIKYTRGHLKVLDRQGLEQRSCECYGVVKAEYARLLPKRTAT